MGTETMSWKKRYGELIFGQIKVGMCTKIVTRYNTHYGQINKISESGNRLWAKWYNSREQFEHDGRNSLTYIDHNECKSIELI